MFGGKKTKASATKPQANPNNTNNAINGLRATIAKLDKREKHIEQQVEKCKKTAAAKVKRKDKRGAMAALKKKQLYEKQLDSIGGKKMNLETQILQLEEAVINTEAINAMKSGTQALKQNVATQDIEEIDEMMDDMHEAKDMADEINVALGQDMADFDDEDLANELAELEELDALEAVEDLPQVQTSPVTTNTDALDGLVEPPQGNTAINTAKTQEEKEEQELASLLA